MTTDVTPDVEILQRAIEQRYGDLARHADRTFHFHHGRPLAQMLGYSMKLVDAMPAAAVECFAGVGNPFSLGLPVSGDKVVDVGCGGGFDCFMAAQAVGPAGRVVGIDMTTAMIEKARHTARQMSLPNVEFHQGLAEDMPLEAASMDVAISNGVINLCPDKHKVFREIFRVLRPGGRLCLSDIVVHRPVPDAARANVDLWTA
jgi:arsenite methyltransferase